MDRRIRVGLAGYGRIAESAHLPAWRELAGVEIVGIADTCEERRRAAAARLPGSRLYDSTLDLVGAEDLDCLDICTPPHDHTPSIVAACEAHVPRIVCEKPLTVGLNEYQAIAAAQSRSGSQVYTVNSWVQSDLHRLVSQVLADGVIGDVRRVVLRTLRPDCALGVSCWQPRWRTDPARAGGGIVLDHGWHQLYLMARWIGAAPVRVNATLTTVQPKHAPVEDHATIELAFPAAEGRIELSWAAPERSNDGEIVGTRGRMVIGDDALTIMSQTGERAVPYGERLSDSSYHPEWFEALFATILSDESHAEGTRNLREAEMLLSTLFMAYDMAGSGRVAIA